MSGSAVSWCSRKQRTVALSSTESEYVAASEAARDAIFVKNLLKEVCGIGISLQIFCDNKAVVDILRIGGKNSRKLRHVDMRYHYIRQLVEEKLLTLQHISTEKRLADVLTKACTRVQHQYCVAGMGLSTLAT